VFLRFGLLLLLLAGPARGEAVRLAVASNFQETARTLADLFEKRSGRRVVLSAASSGKLYAQIRHGAPFDLFLSADAERPQRLAREGRTIGFPRTYAIGRLVYWSPATPGDAHACREGLQRAQRLALANPDTAPYGAAALEVLKRLGLEGTRRVTGENIGQTFAFVASGAVDGGFVAAAQLRGRDDLPGCRWPVPAGLHRPIAQQAALLERGAENEAAHDFFAFLFTPVARERIRAAGYDLP